MLTLGAFAPARALRADHVLRWPVQRLPLERDPRVLLSSGGRHSHELHRVQAAHQGARGRAQAVLSVRSLHKLGGACAGPGWQG